ncbi:MAG: type VI secretion system contractile sheath small subunit [Alphaproteobacteria bacterium]
MPESIQHKLSRVRPPRVQITYDVEIGNAIEMKELPFVVGILADLSVMPENPLPKVKERKFVEIDRDNFNYVMTSIKPRLALRVGNKIDEKEEFMSTILTFEKIDDFDPLNVVKQVPALAKLYESRSFLKDLLTKLDGNDELDQLLTEVMKSPEDQGKLKGEVGGGKEKAQKK